MRIIPIRFSLPSCQWKALLLVCSVQLVVRSSSTSAFVLPQQPYKTSVPSETRQPARSRIVPCITTAGRKSRGTRCYSQVGDSTGSASENGDNNSEQDKTGDWAKSPNLLRLAELSLKDYNWRVSFFKNSEADRKVEESLARMMGDEPSYVRPMDASEEKIGPLGLLERSSVDWLRQVFDEEAIRAKKIVEMGGMMVRPYQAETPEGELGPLGFMEKQFVDFLDNIRTSEKERSRTKILRPKDMDETMRGPLGDAEVKAVETLRDLLEAEKLRAAQSRNRDEVVRPIDVPGPLGEIEMAVLEIVKAERQRVVEKNEDPERPFVRPMDASMKGPLGELEEQAMAVVDKLTSEEKERLRNLQKFIYEKRPMEQDKKSLLGILETFTVGLVRAPILVYQLLSRISELLQSETLPSEDSAILESNEEKSKTER